MATNLVVFKILFLILIAHTFSYFHSFSLAHQVENNKQIFNLTSRSDQFNLQTLNSSIRDGRENEDRMGISEQKPPQRFRSQQRKDSKLSKRSARDLQNETHYDTTSVDQTPPDLPENLSHLQDSNDATTTSGASGQPDVSQSVPLESATVVENGAATFNADLPAPESQPTSDQQQVSVALSEPVAAMPPNLVSIATSEPTSGRDGIEVTSSSGEQQVATSEGISSVAPSFIGDSDGDGGSVTSPPPNVAIHKTTGRFQRNKEQEGFRSRTSATDTVALLPPPPLQIQTAPQVNYAELCYLSNGGSSLTLTVNEATQIGAVIGTIDVNGDPSLQSGNVELMDLSLASSSSSSSSSANTYTNANQRTNDNFNGDSPLVAGDNIASSPPQSSAPPPPSHISSIQQQPPAANQQAELPTSFYSIVQPNGFGGASTSGLSGPSNQSPIRLEPGTKNLVLVRKLDKESSEGESSLLMNIKCKPLSREHQSESTTIPVRILITDANDHAPEFIVGPGASMVTDQSGQSIVTYQVNISETSPIGSIASREILAQDKDSAGPFSTLHYRVVDDGSQASRLLQFPNPLDPTLLVSGPLDYETLSSFLITITASDQGEPEPLSATAQVQVNVIDFDDQNPKFLDEKYSLVMDETQQSLVGQNLQVLPRNLYAEDGDKGIGAQILYSFDKTAAAAAANLDSNNSDDDDGVSGRSASIRSNSDSNNNGNDDNFDLDPSTDIERYLHLHPTSGEIRLLRQWPTAATGGGNKWSGAPMTLVVRAAQADNRDRYTLTTLTITTRQASGSIGSGVSIGSSGLSTASAMGAGRSGLAAGSQAQLGIEFSPSRLTVNVIESVPINEKIARVRARFLGRLANALVSTATTQTTTQSTQSTTTNDQTVVDLVQPQPPLSRRSGSSASGGSIGRNQQQVVATLGANNNQRPINYQILDDQTDHFGINGMGEIFVKRQLDYELRQEFKFRVLATYTKYSDICQVQVNVLNVNDNKPKFSQPQYTFHVTESRLRSNLIGSVQAHDADLNDTIHYSLSGDRSSLFEINTQGQISLRARLTNQQLNLTQYTFTVLATDTLRSGTNNNNSQQHTAQARVNLHIAPQLIGRSLNLEPSSADQLSKSFNSRSLASTDNVAANNLIKQKEQSQVIPSSQRSSVATIVSSLQHMARSVNFLEMPMSSALLLSALLAFLVCLLLIVIISMSVHFYRRHTKSSRRRQLTAAAQLRHAHMAARLQAVSQGGPNPAQLGAHNDRRFRGNRSSGSSPSYDTNDSHGSSPTNSTGAGSGNNSSRNHQQQQHQQVAATQASKSLSVESKGNKNNQVVPLIKTSPLCSVASGNQSSSSATSLLTTTVAMTKKRSSPLTSKLTAKVAPSSDLNNNTLYQAITSVAPMRNGTSTCHQSSNNNDSLPRSHIRSPLEVLSAQLSDTVNQARRNQRSPLRSQRLNAASATPTQMSSISCAIGNNTNGRESSLISSLSSQSKRSYLSNTTDDDSSVMHCGHYSVQGAQAKSPSNDYNGRAGNLSAGLVRQSAFNLSQSPIEAAIESLVRGGKPIGTTSTTNEIKSQNLYLSPASSAATSNGSGGNLSGGGGGNNKYADMRFSQQSQQELAALTSSKPGIKSYRKLPLMGSLVRPVRQKFDQHTGNLENIDLNQELAEGAYMENQRSNQQDSAIVSDASQSSGRSVVANGDQNSGGLIAIGKPIATNGDSETTAYSTANGIKWPNGSIPQRVKRLTWDDELSCAGIDDATQLANSNDNTHLPVMDPYHYQSHLYDPAGRSAAQAHATKTPTDQQQQQHQHFLFTPSPTSPALLSAGDLNSQSQTENINGITMNSHQVYRNNNSDNINSSLKPDGTSDSMMIMGQNNCLDYTIVQSSQFHVDSLAFENQKQTSNGHQMQGEVSPLLRLNLASNYHQQQQHHQNRGPFTMLPNRAIFSPQLGNNNQESTNHNVNGRPLTTAVL